MQLHGRYTGKEILKKINHYSCIPWFARSVSQVSDNPYPIGSKRDKNGTGLITRGLQPPILA
jgi:hypothetical protein